MTAEKYVYILINNLLYKQEKNNNKQTNKKVYMIMRRQKYRKVTCDACSTTHFQVKEPLVASPNDIYVEKLRNGFWSGSAV